MAGKANDARPAPDSWLAGKGPGASDATTRRDQHEPTVSRQQKSYQGPGTTVRMTGHAFSCTVPGCPNQCTVSADELAIGFPQWCDEHINGAP